MISLKLIKPLTKVLLAEDTLMPKLNLRQPGFTYNACGPFTKHRERIQIFKVTGNLRHIYKYELDKVCFVHDAAYSDSKILAEKCSDQVLKDRADEIAINPEYDSYQTGLASIVYNLFDMKTGSGAITTSKARARGPFKKYVRSLGGGYPKSVQKRTRGGGRSCRNVRTLTI